MNAILEKAGLVALVEFGATARGDADRFSDRDIFVLVEDMEPESIASLRAQVAQTCGTSASSVACYTVSTVDRMISLGSLFLWHLRLEGKVLWDPDGAMAEALSALCSYDSKKRDVDRFGAVYRDVVVAFERTGVLSAFECHVLFGIARNTCMLLTVAAGDPAFGRSAVLSHALSYYPTLPLSSDVFHRLEAGHLRYHRGAEIEWSPLVAQEAAEAMTQIERLLEFAEVNWAEGASLDLRGAAAVLVSGRRPSYRVRLQIERAIVERLSECLAVECRIGVQHVDAVLSSTVRGILEAGQPSTRVTECVDAAVQAIACLRELASFDP